MKMRAFLLALLLLAPTASMAALWELDGSGRAFSFFTRGDPMNGDERQAVSFQRLRLEGRLWLGEGWSFELGADLSSLIGPSGTEVLARAPGTPLRWRDFDGELETGDGYALLADLDRCRLTYEHPRFSVDLGRQAISLGGAWILPAFDLFAPFPPGALDTEFRRGVDALRVGIPYGLTGELDLMAVAHEDSLKAGTLLAMLRGDARGFSVTLLGGVGYTEPFVGGALAGDLFGAPGYLEAMARTAEGANETLRLTAGLQRRLMTDLDAGLEYHYSAYGGETPMAYPSVLASDAFLRGELFLVGRHYLALNTSWQARPLLRLSAFALRNLDDRSTLLQPALLWDFAQEAAVGLGAAYGFGDELRWDFVSPPDPGSEFGMMPDTVFAELRFYF